MIINQESVLGGNFITYSAIRSATINKKDQRTFEFESLKEAGAVPDSRPRLGVVRVGVLYLSVWTGLAQKQT